MKSSVGSRAVPLLVIAPALGLALAACGSATTRSTGRLSHADTQALNASSFVTAYPVGWSLVVKPLVPGATEPHATTRYELSSTGARLNGDGIPPPGTIGITIYETPLSTIEREDSDPTAKTGSAMTLATHVVGTPAVTQGSTETVKLHQAASLGGAEAATLAFAYTYSGHKNVQVDLVSQRDHQFALQVESDTEPALASQGQVALETITRSWRWR